MATRRGQESKSRFKIILDGVEIPGFIKVHGLKTQTEIIEKQSDNTRENGKYPGQFRCNNIILFKKRTRNQTFWNWLQEIQEGNFEKRNITIELIYRNKPLRGWKLINCWPCSWSISDITDGVLDTIEEIELVVEKIELL